jgi:type I restriction enzyme S subunit
MAMFELHESTSNAPSVELGTICEITAGPAGSLLKDLPDVGTGVPMVSPRDFTEFRTIDHSRLRRVPQAEAEKLERFSLRENDIIMVRQGSLGGQALVSIRETDWLYSSSCLRIRLRTTEVIPGYLSAYLTYSRSWVAFLQQQTVGTTVPLLTSSALGKFPVVLPDVARQLAITEALQALDGQIAVEREIIARLASLRPSIVEVALEEAMQ